MPSPAYKQSPFYSALKPLRVEAKRVVELLSKRKQTSYLERAAFATAKYAQSLFDSVNDMAKQFDGYRLLGPVHLVQLSRYISQFKKMLSTETLLEQHGSVAYFVFQEIREKSMKYRRFNPEEISNYFFNNKDKFYTKLTNQIGTDDSILTIYELMKNDACASWPQNKNEVETRFCVLYQKYFGDSGPFKAYQFQLTAESTSLMINLTTVLATMPSDFKALTPFFNPDSIVINEKNKSLWLSSLQLLMPGIEGITLTRHANTDFYEYTSKTERHCFRLETKYQYYKKYVFAFCFNLLQPSGVTLDQSLLNLLNESPSPVTSNHSTQEEMGLSNSPQGTVGSTSSQERNTASATFNSPCGFFSQRCDSVARSPTRYNRVYRARGVVLQLSVDEDVTPITPS